MLEASPSAASQQDSCAGWRSALVSRGRGRRPTMVWRGPSQRACGGMRQFSGGHLTLQVFFHTLHLSASSALTLAVPMEKCLSRFIPKVYRVQPAFDLTLYRDGEWYNFFVEQFEQMWQGGQPWVPGTDSDVNDKLG